MNKMEINEQTTDYLRFMEEAQRFIFRYEMLFVIKRWANIKQRI